MRVPHRALCIRLALIAALVDHVDDTGVDQFVLPTPTGAPRT